MRVPKKDTFRQKTQTKYLQHKDRLRTKPSTEAYKKGYDNIDWGKKQGELRLSD